MRRYLIYTLLLGLLLRFTLTFTPLTSELLLSRFELTSPQSSLKRIREALFLIQHGKSPYAGHVYHQSPLLLLLFEQLQRHPLIITQTLYWLMDCVSAVMIYDLAKYYQRYTDCKYVKPSTYQHYPLLQQLPLLTSSFYLLNPLTVLSCHSLASSLFSRVLVTLACWCAVRGVTVATAATLATAIVLDVYPVVLIVPLCLLLKQRRETAALLRQLRQVSAASSKSNSVVKNSQLSNDIFVSNKSAASTVMDYLPFVLLVVLFSSVLLYLSGVLLDYDWSFLRYTHLFNLSVSDLTPNTGLFWYLFTEMFDRFRSFFLIILNTHILFYILPLFLRFQTEPFLLLTICLQMISVFRVNAHLADWILTSMFLLSNLPILLPALTFKMIVLYVVSTFCSVICSVMWQMWIVSGSGNANFVYFQSLISAGAQAVICCETVGAGRRIKAQQHKSNNNSFDRQPNQSSNECSAVK